MSLKDGNFFTNIKKAENAVKGFGGKLDNTTGKVGIFGTGLSKIKDPISSITSGLKGLIATYATFSTIKGAGALSDEMSETKARLNMVNDGLQTTQELNNMIFKSAKDSRGEYKTTADLVTQLGNNCGSVFKSTKETVTFAEQLNKRFVIAGASSSEANNAITQLAQGLAAGTLRGDELNSVLEQAPNIARSIESYMGIAQGSIKQAAEQGLVTADVVKNAILSSADETNAKFEQMPMTWSQIWQGLKTTALQSSSGIFDAISQIANGEQFQGLVERISQGIGSLAESGVVENFANKMIDAANKGITVISTLAQNWDKVKVAIGIVAGLYGTYKAAVIASNVAETVHKGLLIATSVIMGTNTATLAGCTTAQLAHAAALGVAQVATGALTVGQNLLNASFLASPIGWIVLGIAALVAIFAVLWNKCEGFRNFWINAWNGIKNVASAAWGGIKAVGSTVLDAVKTTASEKLGNIKSAYEQHGGGIKGAAAAAWQGIKEYYTIGFDFINNLTGGKLGSMLSTVTSKLTEIKNNFVAKFQEIKDGIKSKIDAAFNTVKSVVDKIKGLFNFEFKMPKIKVPSVEKTGTKTILGVEVPTFGIKWNAQGGIFRRPTVLSTPAGMQGFGEAGAEAVLPLSQFWTRLRQYIGESRSIGTPAKAVNNVINITVNTDGGADPSVTANIIAKKVKEILDNM